LGVIDLQSDEANRFSEGDIRIHATLAAQVAVALQNATLYAEQLETAERLREVDRLKSEFLASMSHELRTPLNSIIGFADVLLEGIDGPLNERMVEDVTLIRDSGRHLRSLIGEMLDMSKIEAGVMELFYEEVDVPALAQEILANARTLAKDKELDIQLELAPDLDKIEADRTRLTQILLNLMGNAVKFTEQGSIILSLEERGGRLMASVQDTGIGIRQEDIPAIFEQFRQVDGSLTRKAGGTGLGVPISRSLVELHGGEMWVESEPGVGSTFLFSIPVEKPEAS
jgi:signal transduction histidine kinase